MTKLRYLLSLLPSRSDLSNAFLVAVLVVILLILSSLLWRMAFNDPPITLVSVEPEPLGVLCPGTASPILLRVTVKEPLILHYYISVLDEAGLKNVIGTQRAYTDMQHPRTGTIMTDLSWQVPDIKPGRYIRSVGSRNISGSENTVWSLRSFEVADPGTCPVPLVPQ